MPIYVNCMYQKFYAYLLCSACCMSPIFSPPRLKNLIPSSARSNKSPCKHSLNSIWTRASSHSSYGDTDCPMNIFGLGFIHNGESTFQNVLFRGEQPILTHVSNSPCITAVTEGLPNAVKIVICTLIVT